MVFVPFTGIDNHKKCVTFGAGLMVKEDEASYIWLLENFLKAMGSEPYYIITDQDPAMKNAVRATFKQARHRLCMWHIMEKVKVKVPTLAKDNNFMNRLNEMVWDIYMNPEEFEENWVKLMNDFALTENQWFTTLFQIRKSWIPAYFKDAKMGGLLKTTSRSESVNSWFGGYKSESANLVEFFMHFESAMDAQRHVTSKLDHECVDSPPECKTPLKIEKHAAKVYTKRVFSEVQMEIEAACFRCVTVHIEKVDETTRYKVAEVGRDGVEFIVNKCGDLVGCSCKMFEQFGLLCRHTIMLVKDLERIPEVYLLNRWLKAASSGHGIDNARLNPLDGKNQRNAYLNSLWSDFYCCISLAEGSKDKLEHLSKIINEEKNHLLGAHQVSSSILSKEAVIQEFCGSVSNLDVDILPPKQAKNKGSGSTTKSRLLSQREKSIKESQKLKRRCGKCGEVGNHNSRTCNKTRE